MPQKIAVIYAIAISCVLSWVYADECIIVDNTFYEEHSSTIPPRIVKRVDVDNYYEIHIAPANEYGVSYNQFKKIYAMNMDGLLLINNPDPDPLGSAGNENLEYSKTDDYKAKTIYIKINDGGLSEGTFLHGLVQVIGGRAHVIIESDMGVIIDSAFFRNMESLSVEARDLNNILVGPAGLHADSAFKVIANDISITGPIYIPSKDLFFYAGTCGFTENGAIKELGGFDAVCKESFVNHGHLKMQGVMQVETGSFLNEAIYNTVPWGQDEINALSPELRRDFIYNSIWPQAVPYNDIAGRTYEKRISGSGVMSANNYIINVTKGDFINRNGGQIYATEAPPVYSQIVVNGAIQNIHKHLLTGQGYFQDGFDIERSVMNFAGNATLYSQLGEIRNEGSELIVGGNSWVRAGTKILNLHAEGRFLKFMTCAFEFAHPVNFKVSSFEKRHCAMPGKGRMCNIGKKPDDIFVLDNTLMEVKCRTNINQVCACGKSHADYAHNFLGKESPSDHYIYRNVPGILRFHGEHSEREAFEGITEVGSLYFPGRNYLDKPGGPHILQAVAIDPISEQKAIDEVKVLLSGSEGTALVQQLGGNIVAHAGNEAWGRIGGIYGGHQGVIYAPAGMSILNGAQHMVGKGGLDLIFNGPINIIGAIDPHENYISMGNKQITTWGFNVYPSMFVIHGSFNIHSDGGSWNMNGGIVMFQGDATVNVPAMTMVPLTMMKENYYHERKKKIFSSGEITIRESTVGVIPSGFEGDGHLVMNIDDFHCEGCVASGKQGTSINSKNANYEPHVIDHYRTVTTTSSGLILPGIFNSALSGLNSNFDFRSIHQNVPIAGAIYNLAHTKSASDMAPSVLFLAEAYSMADGFSRAYEASGSTAVALGETALDQFGVRIVGGIPVPSSIGFGTVKTERTTNWQTAIPARVGGENVAITTDDLHAKGLLIEAVKNCTLIVNKKLYLDSQTLVGSENFSQKGKTFTLSVSNNGFAVSGSRQTAEAHSETMDHLLSRIIAGDTVTVMVGEDADLTGTIKAPTVKVQVAGKLLLKTVQNTGQGSSSQNSINGGVSITSAGITPSGGFQYGDGEWSRAWADEQTGIFGDHVEVDVGRLIVDAAVIQGLSGHVNADSIEYKNMVNRFEEKSRSLGFDTNFVNFLINPANSARVTAAANAIKGMAVFGDEDESAYQSLLATISKNLEINTKSNIDGLNRDDSKAQGPVSRSSHKFSLALPVVDWKELGEGLERIGMTARDINEKMQGVFEKTKQQAKTQEEKNNIEVQEKLVEDFYDVLDENDVLDDHEKGEAFKDFVETTISVEFSDFVAVSNAKENIIGQKPIEKASAEELLYLAQAISETTEMNFDCHENHRLFEDYAVELAEYGIDIEVAETFGKAKHIPTTLAGKMADKVGNTVIQVEKGFDKVLSTLWNKMSDEARTFLLAVSLMTTQDAVLKKGVSYVGLGALNSAEYVLGEENLATAKEYAGKTIEYVVDHSTEGQRKFVGVTVDGASIIVPLFKAKTLAAVTILGLKKELQPDLADGAKTLARIGLKHEGVISAAESCPKVVGIIEDLTHPSTPVGRKGREIKIQSGTNTRTFMHGREYSGHALDRMQERGLTPTMVEDVIKNGIQSTGNMPNRILHYDPLNEVVIVTEGGNVITVRFGGLKI